MKAILFHLHLSHQHEHQHQSLLRTASLIFSVYMVVLAVLVVIYS